MVSRNLDLTLPCKLISIWICIEKLMRLHEISLSTDEAKVWIEREISEPNKVFKPMSISCQIVANKLIVWAKGPLRVYRMGKGHSLSLCGFYTRAPGAPATPPASIERFPRQREGARSVPKTLGLGDFAVLEEKHRVT